MKSDKYCVILAGGAGLRCWPKSRKAMPKQFLDMLGSGKSSIRHTFERFEPMVAVERFVVVTTEPYRELVLEHLPELRAEQVLCEPVGRNTAPSVCYAAHSLLKRDPDAEIIITPADHFLSCEDEFREAIAECAEFASQHKVIVSLGIRATHPETGYGYIQTSNSSTISKVKCFTEKPSREVAQMFLCHKEFYWNSGIFVCRADVIIRAFERHLPDCAALFDSIDVMIGSPLEYEALSRIYAECRSISIDYGVMELVDDMYIKCGDFGWCDVGTWESVYQLCAKDEIENSINDNIFTFNTQGSLISLPKDKIAVVSGLKDYVVVDTSDALLICPRGEVQEIRKFIDEVKYNKGDKFL